MKMRLNPVYSRTQPYWVIGLTLLTLTLNPVAFAQTKKKAQPIPKGVKVEKNLVFATHDSIDLKLDLYLSEEKPSSPMPAVIWIHGGGWLNGSKDKCMASFLAQNGFAVASVGYRLVDKAEWPGQIDDCYAAVKWLRTEGANYGIDGSRIGAWGSSAGGHLVALMGTRKPGEESEVSTQLQAVCDWFGPTNLLTMPPNNVSETRTAEQVANSNGAKLLGATVREVPDLAKDASALFHVSKEAAPFLIMHGSEDPGVPLVQSTTFHEALQKAGAKSELVIVEGAGHGGKGFQTIEVRNTVRTFFIETLKP
ncbi:alpha/beta hydrolase [Verrucomicrobiales bacterium]|jgi:acetyl esterase/lipase|nr:alpha/beta hydrolase [Verrucomicrobiales bacterium]MDB4358708.1 alpha/beta hydrolase [Verrucomicrobiales bacterium]